MSEETKKNPEVKVRRKRVPLGSPRRKLEVPKKEGKVRRWVNDKGSRLLMAQEGGYNFVEDDITPGDPDVKNQNRDLGSKVCAAVGTKDDGSPMYAYLMEIDEETYMQDQEEKQEELNIVENALRRGQDQQGTVGVDGRYVPKDGITIK